MENSNDKSGSDHVLLERALEIVSRSDETRQRRRSLLEERRALLDRRRQALQELREHISTIERAFADAFRDSRREMPPVS